MSRRKRTYRLMVSGSLFLLGIILASAGSALDNPMMITAGMVICFLGGLGWITMKALGWLKRHSRRH